MTAGVFFIILTSAIFHASWNLICKKRKASGTFFFILTFGNVMLWMPLALYILCAGSIRIPPAVWLILVLSGLSNAVYYLGLGYAYRNSDMSLSYPLVKAFPILMVTGIFMFTDIGKSIASTLPGVTIIIAGSIMIPMKHFSDLSLRNYLNRSFAFILVAAAASTSYMILDNTGMKTLSSITGTAVPKYQISCLYIFFENLFILPFLIVFIMKNGAERNELKSFFENFSFTPFIAGTLCTVSYSLILMAMSMSDNISLVVALRQLSVPIGAMAGILLLKESCPFTKIFSVILILGGLLLIYLI